VAALPNEVPLTCDGEGRGGESEWIAAFMPESAEADPVGDTAPQQQHKAQTRPLWSPDKRRGLRRKHNQQLPPLQDLRLGGARSHPPRRADATIVVLMSGLLIGERTAVALNTTVRRPDERTPFTADPLDIIVVEKSAGAGVAVTHRARGR
jgi:hypothetical protein